MGEENAFTFDRVEVDVQVEVSREDEVRFASSRSQG